MDRLSANDLTTLATDRGPAPMHIAAVLVVDPPAHGPCPEAADVARLLGRRVVEVPRLRQRLHRAPVGLGRPYWVDDTGFDVGRHLHVHAAEGLEGLLGLAAEVVCRPLPRDRPLWAAHWVTGVGSGRCALVVVVHHVVADGIGGLAVLRSLADPPTPDPLPPDAAPSTRDAVPPDAGVSSRVIRPTPRAPTRRDLARDAWAQRAASVRALPRQVVLAVSGLRALGVGHPRLVARTSLNRPTGPTRRIGVVDRSLEEVAAAAHHLGCTVNDLVVTAVGGALVDVLDRRGERVGELVVSVPYSARRATTARDLGNTSGVVPFRVPGSGADARDRLRRVHAQSAAQLDRPRAASAAPLGLAFRWLAQLGIFAWFIDRQRLVTTFVTNVHGPTERLRLGGCEVSQVVPVAVTPGNTTVTFDVLSYAGRLCVTVVADPAAVPDREHLTTRVGARLDELTG
ncbi:wax ester/triacylglycerol synthase domain-containing protein [Intrasporangium sp. YIM S08009]|uniref:wax ester/triacylglycerol synthase domain-containing protein n=1 Tax=Intrasporangium zincisolvens TaxID=3080018 RepID=UPI002B05A2F8|nr:wax ester/triacylglycerol synthase domain-containing protein [Intrasporangium sp. YIM S08009]